jgi:hypothetical protein
MTSHHPIALSILAVAACSVSASAAIVTFSGVNATYAAARASFLADHLSLTGEAAPLENFDTLNPALPVGDMPGNDGRFAPEYADGSPAPLPIIQVFAGAPSPAQWMINFGNGRPTGSSWVIRPDDPGESIYAFAQTNAQGDWVRITGYDAAGATVVTLDASNAGTAFAGFISDVPIAKVVVTPLGNFDFANGMDDVYVGTTPVPAPASIALAACGGLIATRRRRGR